MDSTVLSVSWKDHSGALIEVCKTLLDNNFLVDCTIAAEGKALKAHRLILSACSPYFQMLFGEDCEKHPIVILQNASFETLKAMIDFMYHGETQVPEERLEAFLTLAETLQIKGLNDSSKKNRRKLQSVDSTRETRHRLPPEDQKVTCEVQIASASHEPSPENSSEQHHSYQSEEYTHVTENCSVSLEGNNSSFETVIQSSQQMPPLPQQESRDTEQNVKSEPMHHVYIVPKHEQMDEDEGDEPPQDVSECDINEEATSGFDEQHMNQYSSVPSCSDSGNVLPGAFAMPQMAGPPEVQGTWRSPTPQHQELMPHLRCDECSATFNTSRKLARHRGLHRRDQLNKCNVCGKIFARKDHLRTHLRAHTGERPYACVECGKTFIQASALAYHKRCHTGERPYPCDTCGKAFIQASALAYHKRSHTGERPYPCNMCEKAFTQSGALAYHMRSHARKRSKPSSRGGRGSCA